MLLTDYADVMNITLFKAFKSCFLQGVILHIFSDLLQGEEKAKGKKDVAHLSQVFLLDSNPVD
jgi:hypothetical protein